MQKKSLPQESNSNGKPSRDKSILKAYLEGPAAFSNLARLKHHTGRNAKEIQNFLNQTNSYTKYRITRRKFRRLKVIAYRINEIWSMDLAFMDKLAKYNNGVKYLLVAVDVLSRYVRVEPIKDKYAKSVVIAFRKMLKGRGKPEKVWVDEGTEFKGAFAEYCDKSNIQVYSTHSETKSCFAERNIRSLKNIIYRYLEEKWTYSYIKKLPDFVKTINTRVNRVIKKAPSRITKQDVPRLVALATPVTKKQRKKFKVGQVVRIAKKDEVFKKGYKQTFTDEVFTVDRVATTNPFTYNLKDRNGDQIEGKFYTSELTLAAKS